MEIAVKTKEAMFTIATQRSLEEILTVLTDLYVGFSLEERELVFTYNNNADYILSKLKNKWVLYNVNGTPTYGTTISEIIAKISPQWYSLQDKIIRFHYDGVFAIGNRVVEVHEVKEDRLVGVDLVTSESRSYLFSKIKKFPQVIN